MMKQEPALAAGVQTRPRSASVAWIEALAATASIGQDPHQLLSHIIGSLAEPRSSTPALLSDRECFTFGELAARIERYARWAASNRIKPGDRVALLMPNRPEYVAAWLGLTKMGVVVALINTNLTDQSLAHCLDLADPSHIIVEASLTGQLASVIAELDGKWTSKVWCHGESSRDIDRIDRALDAIDPSQSLQSPVVCLDDKALLIYTSGTTGLPKAAYVSHRRILNWALWFKGLLGNTEADRMYDCLPLYHSVGGVVAVAATLVAGGSTVIAEKFSARRFWDDIRRWECTQFQYIGELCRYLLNAPASDADTLHGLRLVCGNGLRADVWTPFKERFGIPQVVEFYAATEGNFSLFNAEGKPGAIGRIPPFLRHRFPTAIVKFDADLGMPPRGADGLCVLAETGEAGEALGRIGDGSDASGRFEGYTSSVESERKILRDVLRKGDMWFRTGDLMRVDAAGYYYFVDRIGDTFRWKGENVSTLEVANVLTEAPGVQDAVVYGVDVPGSDGKAGMAFLETGAGFDLQRFHVHTAKQLPGYALPVFLRIGTSAVVTETFKHKKQDLMREGFDPLATSDEIHVRITGQEGYMRLDKVLHAGITAGRVRL